VDQSLTTKLVIINLKPILTEMTQFTHVPLPRTALVWCSCYSSPMTDRRARGPDRRTRALFECHGPRSFSRMPHSQTDWGMRAMNTGAMNPVHARHGPP